MHNDNAIYNQLNATLLQIEKQIRAAKQDIQFRVSPTPKPGKPVEVPDEVLYRQKYQDGKYIMADLLSAKAQVLSAMAIIKAASKKEK